MAQDIRNSASFRDPSGFLFSREGVLYRQVNRVYQADFEKLLGSGLYGDLIDKNLMIPHELMEDVTSPDPETAYQIIRPEQIPFISYPYEWTFLQLRGAALTTLRIARVALQHDMILKDASAYNLQFYQGSWKLIDTLSFETYHEGSPWVAYKQFCQHFLAPLALMAYLDKRLNHLSRLFIDGIPVDLAASLLPFQTKLRLGLLTHIHLHARSQKRYAEKGVRPNQVEDKLSLKALINLLESLRNAVKNLSIKLGKTAWANYYEETNYSKEALEEKKAIVSEWISQVRPENVWDLGANVGIFSRLASQEGIFTVAFDADPDAVAQNYIQVRKDHEKELLPLQMDLTNPSPGLGWAHQERESLLARGPAQLVLALALVHHMAISNNLPFEKLSKFFSQIGKYLIIEFIPKSDSQVQRLLRSRKDIFTLYTIADFIMAFGYDYHIIDQRVIRDSERTLFLMKSK